MSAPNFATSLPHSVSDLSPARIHALLLDRIPELFSEWQALASEQPWVALPREHGIDNLERTSARVSLDPNAVFPTEELLDHAPLLINGIAAYLEQPAREVAADAPVMGKAMELGALRHRQGFDEYQILKKFELLGGIILAHLIVAVRTMREPCGKDELLACGHCRFRAVAIIQEASVAHYLQQIRTALTEREGRLRGSTARSRTSSRTRSPRSWAPESAPHRGGRRDPPQLRLRHDPGSGVPPRPGPRRTGERQGSRSLGRGGARGLSPRRGAPEQLARDRSRWYRRRCSLRHRPWPARLRPGTRFSRSPRRQRGERDGPPRDPCGRSKS